MNLGNTLEHVVATLAPQYDSARLDAEVLVGYVTGKPRHHPYAFPERRLEVGAAAALDVLVERRAAGEPIAYLTGEREFWSLGLKVTPDTLIPRPETEILVEAALALISLERPSRVADLGTGSGAIALAIASERPRCRVVATDISAAALAVARGNAAHHGLDGIDFRPGDWTEALASERFDVIVSNPPYVDDDDPHLGCGDVRFEPRHALAAGPDGLRAIRTICEHAINHLLPDGYLMLEHGATQRCALNELMSRHGYDCVVHHRDHAELDRVTQGRMRTR